MKTMLGSLVTVSLVAVLTAGASFGGGGPVDGGALYGGIENTGFVSPERTSMLGLQWGPRAPQPSGMSQPFGMPERGGRRGGLHPGGMPRGPMRHHPRRGPEHPLLSPRMAMYWMRLDANGRAQLEGYLRQWMGTLTAEQQATLVALVQRRWERMPPFQQSFLSQLWYGASAGTAAGATTTTTSSAASGTTTTITTSTDASATTTTTAAAVDPTTGFPIDPSTGYPVDPSTGYLVDPATGYRYDRTNGVWIDPATGQPVTASSPTTTATVDPATASSASAPATGATTSY